MIRPATAADAAAIADIWNRIIRDTAISFTTEEKTTAGIAALIAERGALGQPFLVAEEGSTVLGFATYGQFRAGPGYARSMEHSINLAPEARGRGLGAALLRALEDHARAAGVRILVGGITATNAASLALHARLGYAEVGRLPDAGWKFGRYHELVFMQKVLD